MNSDEMRKALNHMIVFNRLLSEQEADTLTDVVEYIKEMEDSVKKLQNDVAMYKSSSYALREAVDNPSGY